MARLQGRIALVTGAASGLGAAIAARLAEEGAEVVATDIDTQNGPAMAAAAGGRVHFFKQDVTQAADWEATIAHVLSRFGRLDILVNNAGITLVGDIEEATLESWQTSFDVDLTSVFLGCKAAVGAMKAHGGGSIINISSIAGLRAEPNLPAYNAMKAGVTNLTRSVALYCARQGYGIRCNSVHPGAIQTPIIQKVLDQMDDPQAMLEKLQHDHPLGWTGEPVDIANGVLYLASDEARWVTGTQLVIDGGAMLL